MPNQTTFFLDCFGCFQKIPDFGKVYKIVILLTLKAEETTLFKLSNQVLPRFVNGSTFGRPIKHPIERSVRTRLSV